MTPTTSTCDRTANFDRSWNARSVEVEAKIAEVTAYDPWVGIQLELWLPLRSACQGGSALPAAHGGHHP